MKSLNKKIFIITIIIALITSYLTYDYLKKMQQDTNDVEMKTILVASRDILPGEKITKKMVAERTVEKNSYINEGIHDINKLLNQRLKEKVLKGETIPAERLIQDEDGLLSFLIPEGKRAVSIAVDEFNGVADLIKPNDFVDIYVTVEEKIIDMKDSKMIYPETSILLLQNIQVMAVSKQVLKSNTQRTETPSKYAVTVAVSPSDGEKLVLAEETGHIKIALRGMGDDSIHYTPGVIRDDLVTEKGKYTIYK